MNKVIITATTTFLLLFLVAKPSHAQSLEVDFGDPPVAPGDPVFVVQNMLPGDEEEREITVRNIGTSPVPAIMHSEKTNEGIPNWPTTPDGNEFSLVLEIEIYENSTLFYGPTSLEQFFIDSGSGMNLGTLSPSEERTFSVKVKFPAPSGNEYQRAFVVFDLMFAQFHTGSIVINEVYYHPDADHGSDCSSSTCGININAEISGNAAGSVNIIDINVNNTCIVVQKNTANIVNNVNVNTNTGGNSASGNTSSFVSIITGHIKSIVGVINSINVNVGSCSKVKDKNDEWIELYNASPYTIELDGWILQDNSGQQTVLSTNESLAPGQFALISRSLTTWDYWNEDPDAIKIAIGTDCGNGLDNDGDHLYLLDPNGVEVDFVSWGNDTERWDPAVPLVPQGHSMERKSPGFDTDMPSDWEDRSPPTPGS